MMNGLSQQFQTSLRTPEGDALEEFMLLNGRYSNFTKEAFFLRYASGPDFDQDVRRLSGWTEGTRGFLFVPALSPQPPIAQAGRYAALYCGGAFPFRFENPIWQETLERGFSQILELFQEARGRREESILRNFGVKLLYWMDTYFPRLFTDTAKMNRFPKFACGGQIKLAEYLFLYLLFLLGCDVLYISPTGEVPVEPESLLARSLPAQRAPRPAPAAGGEPVPRSAGRVVISRDRIQRPDRSRPSAPPVPAPPVSPSRGAVPPPAPPARRPLEFEELARFAASVVMLKVFDPNNQCFKTGSGVIISDKGYVLTNFHVVSGGHHYGILLEEESDIFYTDELIKYHRDYDLAILRMEKRRTPIPIADRSTALVRGQKVVAIGSPLGLFNSVSDGIISGFRQIDDVDMIQFTAPISHGSSGGAVLNMAGEIIGISTAGIDQGQNINLAVSYESIRLFAKGFY